MTIMVVIIMITTILIKTFVQDLEDFYTAHCGDITGYISALHVANFLRFARIQNRMTFLNSNDQDVKFAQESGEKALPELLQDPCGSKTPKQVLWN